MLQAIAPAAELANRWEIYRVRVRAQQAEPIALEAAQSPEIVRPHRHPGAEPIVPTLPRAQAPADDQPKVS